MAHFAALIHSPMSWKETIKAIDLLKKEVEDRGPLGDEILKKIEYRFRLDWNYYSNNMEGNTLTRRETRTVMAGLLNVKDKLLKDVLEMKGHDDTITQILRIGKGELNLSESRIKEIHRGIMSEEDEAKKKLIGEWKSQDNEVINYKGEKMMFTSHLEVKNEIHVLLNWLNAEAESIRKGKSEIHPVILAFEFHIRFLKIHPFYDGNGRVGRILMNLILIAQGLPPLVIRKEEGEEEVYYRHLADVQAYGAPPDLYYEFMSELLLRSQTLVKDAVEGKDIGLPDDLDKEIALLKAEFAGINDTSQVELTKEWLVEFVDTTIRYLFQKVVEKTNSLKDLFSDVVIMPRLGAYYTPPARDFIWKLGVDDPFFQGILYDFLKRFDQTGREFSIGIDVRLIGFKKSEGNYFNCGVNFVFNLNAFYYENFPYKRPGYWRKPYSEKVSNEEIDMFVINVFKILLTEIREKSGKQNN